MFLSILSAVSSVDQRPVSILSTNHTLLLSTFTHAIAVLSNRLLVFFLPISSKPAQSTAMYHEPSFGSSPNLIHSSLKSPEPALLKEDKYSWLNAKELSVRFAASISFGSIVSLSAVVKCHDFQSSSEPDCPN